VPYSIIIEVLTACYLLFPFPSMQDPKTKIFLMTLCFAFCDSP